MSKKPSPTPALQSQPGAPQPHEGGSFIRMPDGQLQKQASVTETVKQAAPAAEQQEG